MGYGEKRADFTGTGTNTLFVWFYGLKDNDQIQEKNLLRNYLITSAIMMVLFVACGQADGETEMKMVQGKKVEQKSDNLAEIPFETIDGKTTSLADFKGKVVLLVNVASKCGYTPQYAELQELYDTYKDSGLVVIGFPANNFGGQEPGSNKEILNFCQTNFNVTFPMMAKVSVKGGDKHPLFKALTETSLPGEIKWNFSKFLLNRDGELEKRYDSGVKPLSDEIVGEIKALL